MPQDEEAHEQPHEGSHLLSRRVAQVQNGDSSSVMSSAISKEEQALGGMAIGERLPYNDYTTIDWLHDLVRIETSGLVRH